MKYKALLLDIDGILLNQEDDTKPKTWKAINDLITHGILVSFVTARPYGLLSHLVKKVNKSGIHVFENGNFVYEPATEKVHDIIPLDSDVSRSIIDIISKYLPSIRFGYSIGKKFLVNDNYNKELLNYMPIGGYELFDQISIGEQLSIWIKDIQENVYNLLMEAVRDKALVYSYSQPNKLFSFFVHPKLSNKLSGVRKLSDVVGIKLESMVFIGDDSRDIELAKHVGVAAAPANAIDELKKISKIVSKNEHSLAIYDVINSVWG